MKNASRETLFRLPAPSKASSSTLSVPAEALEVPCVTKKASRATLF
jgi:hypothetical protein